MDLIKIGNDIELPIIGQGNTAEVLLYDDNTIIKLFRSEFPYDAIERENDCAKIIHEKFKDTPRVIGGVQKDDRFGIMYERIVGKDFLGEVVKHPLLLRRNGRILADIQLKMHEVEIELHRTVKDKLRWDIMSVSEFSEKEKKILLSRVDRLKDGNRLCHLDFHPGNVILCQDKGSYSVIDWMTACSGNPAADVARTLLLLTTGEPMNAHPLIRSLFKTVSAMLKKCYIDSYLKRSSIEMQEIEDYMVPIAAARLSEWLTDNERKVLTKFVRDKIVE